jgi:hypothetical protein
MLEFQSEKPLQDHIRSELKRDYRFALFYMLPQVRPDSTWMALSEELKISPMVAERFAKDLIRTGLWQMDGEKIRVSKEHIDLGDLHISEFLAMSINLLAQMHGNGPCWYDTLFVVTSDKLKKEYYRKVNQAQKELLEESRAINGDVILAWSHAGLDCLKAIQEGAQ